MDVNLNQVICGDCLEVMKGIPDDTFNMCMTSPPYWGLRDYSGETIKIWGGDETCDHEWVISIMKNLGGGYSTKSTLVGYSSENTKGRKMFRNYKNNTTNFCIKCNAWKGQLGLEPDFNLYIQHLCDIFDKVKRVLRKDGTCWVVIGDTYSSGNRGNEVSDSLSKLNLKKGNAIPDYFSPPSRNNCGIKDKCLIQIPFRFALAMIDRGWILRNTIIWYKRNCLPSSIKDRFTVDFEYVFFFSKNKKYYFEQQTEPSVDPSSYIGRRKRNPNKRAGVKMVGQTLDNHPERTTGKTYPFRNKRCVWDIPTQSYHGNHFAVYPEKLCETPIKAGCPEGGIVLDVFSGAGTTCLVAKKLNRNYIGIEINPEYCEIARKRIKEAKRQMRIEFEDKI